MNIMAFDGCVKIIMRPASRHTILLPFLVLLIVLPYSVMKRLGDLHLSSGHIKSNASRDQATQHDAKVSYVTSFWAKKEGEKVNPHQREVEAALLANIYNPHFDQVVVFFERGGNATESCLDFYQAMSELSRQVFFGMAAEEESNKLLTAKVNCVDVQTEPSYYDMFSNALSDVVTGDIIVLANADTAFDESMSLVRSLNPEVLVVLGTSGFTNKMPPYLRSIYEETMSTESKMGHRFRRVEADRCAGPLFSWDTYVFHKSKLMGRLKEEDFKRPNENNEMVFFYMNENGAENAALWALQQSYPFSSTYNACDRIQSWHFHLAPKTHRRTPWLQVSDVNSPLYVSYPGLVPKPYGFPKKTSTGDPPDCVRTESCFLQ